MQLCLTGVVSLCQEQQCTLWGWTLNFNSIQLFLFFYLGNTDTHMDIDTNTWYDILKNEDVDIRMILKNINNFSIILIIIFTTQISKKKNSSTK